MPAKNPSARVTGYPDFDALAVLGYDPEIDGQTAIVQGPARRLARLIEHATAEITLTRGEWNAIAEVMNGTADLYDYADSDIPPGLMITANLQDSPGIGEKWGINVKKLTAKIRSFSPLQLEAVLCAVRWAWRNSELWDCTRDSWWSPAWRRMRAGK